MTQNGVQYRQMRISLNQGKKTSLAPVHLAVDL